MPIPDIDVFNHLELPTIVKHLESETQLHEWDGEKLIKAFAFRIHPRWFHPGHIHDLFRSVSLQNRSWETPLNSLVEARVLVSDTPQTHQYRASDGQLYDIYYCHRIERAAHAQYEKVIAAILPDPPPVEPNATEVLSPTIVTKAKGYVQEIVLQANGCYQNRWFDACSVMVRKLIENLIIAVYEHHGRAQDIQASNGNFLMLGALIDRILADPAFTLGRETKTGLPLIKELGDRAAHNRHFMAKKPDVDKAIKNLRVIVSELLMHSGIKA